MVVSRRALGAMAMACLVGSPSVHAAKDVAVRADFGGVAVSADVRDVVEWIVGTTDNRGLSFAVFDKKDARGYVFSARGRLVGETPILLGIAPGDHSVPGVGDLPLARIPLAARTTPAGRFASEPGHNMNGEDVVWFDYAAGLAIHRLRPDAAQESRRRRLASEAAAAHRISAGCIVVPIAFYDGVVKPMLGKGRGVVYVLPEMRSAREVFTAAAGELPAD